MIRIHPRKESRMESPSIIPQSGFYWTGWGYTIGGTVLVNYESGHCLHQELRGNTEQVEYILEAPPSLIQAFQSRMQKSKRLTSDSDQTSSGYDTLYIADQNGVSTYSISFGCFSGGDIYETLCWIRNTIKEQGLRKVKKR